VGIRGGERDQRGHGDGVCGWRRSGARDGRVAVAGVARESVGDDYLGRSVLSGEQPRFDGALSNVAFYTKALSAAQVKEHYAAGEFPVNVEAPSISGAAREGSVLKAKAGSWTGLAPISFAYQWQRCYSAEDCPEIAGATETSYEASSADVGHTLRVEVAASNGTLPASKLSAATVTVEAAKPSNTRLPVISGEPWVQHPLSVDEGVWKGTPPLAYAYQWESCNGSGQSCKAIPEATSTSYTPSLFQAGSTLRVKLTAENVAGSKSVQTGTTPPLTLGPPVNTEAPTITGTALQGETLTANNGSWLGEPPITYTDQWEECNDLGGGCLPIVGATSSSYTIGEGDVGSTLRVAVTAANVAGEASTNSNVTGVVVGGGPVIISPPEVTGVDEEGWTLSASTGSWSGGSEISYEYQWLRCDSSGGGCTEVPGATGATYALQSADVQGSVRVTVTALDAEGATSSTSEATGVVTEGAPRTPRLALVSEFGSTGEGQLSLPVADAVDAQGNVWVASLGDDRIEEFNEAGEYVREFGSAGSEPGELEEPVGLALDRHGDVWVLDLGNRRVEEFTGEGEFLRAVGGEGSGTSEVGYAEGIAAAPDGDIWVSVSGAGHLDVFSEGGELLRTVGSSGAGAGQIGVPEQLAVDRGDVWVADWSNGRVEEFSEDGEYLREFGSIGAGEGQLESPFGIAVDEHGRIWVGNPQGARVEEFSEEGEYLGKVESSQLGEPAGLAAGDGALWAVDFAGGRVEKWSDPVSDTEPPMISGEARDGQTLTGGTGTWEGSPPISYDYQWERCNATGGECEDVSGATGSTYTLGDADVSGAMRLVVTASNVAGSAAASSAASGRVAAVAPSNTGLPSISGSAVQGEALSASPGSWGGAPAPTYTFRWQRCGPAGEGCADIAGATGSSYLLGQADVDETVRVRVTATNAARSASASSPVTGTIAGTGAVAPSSVAAPAIAGSLEAGQTVSASAGSWSGTQPLAYVYQWESCNAAGSACEAIEGATGSSYTLGADDEGRTLRVLVGASGPGGQTQALSPASGEVQPGAPSELQGPSVSGSPSVGEMLYAEPGDWGGGEDLFAYQWERCDQAGGECVAIPGSDEAEYTPEPGDAGATLRVRVGASNAQGSVTAISPASSPVQPAGMLLNTAAPLISGEPVSGGTLTASAGGWLGGQALSYAYQWQRCDIYGSACEDIEGASAAGYTPGEEDVGNTLRVIVAASEAEGSASEISPVTLPVAAQGAPEAEQPPGLAGTGLVGYTLSATAGEWSGQEGDLSYGYQWERCSEAGEACATIAGAAEASYTLTEEDAGSAVRVLVKASDPGGSSEAASAPIIASAPAATDVSPPQVSGSDQPGRPLHAEPGIWTGAARIVFAYEWQRCGETGEGCEPIGGAEVSSYTPQEEDSGRPLRVLVTGTNPAGSSGADSPDTPAIGSEPTAPEDSVLPVIEGPLTAGETLTVAPGSWFGSEPISYGYQWQRCDQEAAECMTIEGASGQTYTLGEADVGSTIRAIVTASNSAGSERASSEASEPVGAPGPPANTQAPAVTGQPTEGQQLFAENGIWSGSRPLSYYYQWKRCNPAGEACTDIEGATKPLFTLSAADVGSTLRVNVTTANELGSAGSLSAATVVVASATPADAAQALEAIEAHSPSLLARSTTAQIEEQALTPALDDAGEQLSVQSTLASSTISKATPGELAVETADGELSLTPVEPAPNAASLPTLANGAAALFPETWSETYTIVRPSALGEIALLQLRSQQAPTSFSWEVGIGPDQRLQQLPDGSIAIIEPTPQASLEGPLGEEGPEGPGPSEAPPEQEGEGVSAHAGEEELESSLTEEAVLPPLPAAPTVSTPETAPREGELHPQDTEAVYERDASAMSYAESQTDEAALMVIETPTVLDAAGDPVPATLAVDGDTITLTLSPTAETSYPVSAEIPTSAPADLVSVARDPVSYGLSDPKAPVFESLNPRLKDAPLKIRVARDVVPFYAWTVKEDRETLINWLKAVGKSRDPVLEPYITLEAGGRTNVSYAEYQADVEGLVNGVVDGNPAEGIPTVTRWGAWNEPDNKEDVLGPDRAANFWKLAHAIVAEHRCGCSVAAGEFERYGGRYVNEYIQKIITDHSYGNAKPHIWGIHDYDDLSYLSAHKGRNVDLAAFLMDTSGKLGKPRIWISETGVQLQDGGRVTPLKTSPAHARLQVAAANDVLKLATGHPRVELVDYYLYEGPTKEYEEQKKLPHAFDSALTAGEGINEQQTPREAYCVLVLDKRKGCPARAATKGPVQGKVGTTTATIEGTVDPTGLPTTYSFEYGQTSAYGKSTSTAGLPSETGEQSATATLSDLEQCTTYHYQVTAENEANEAVPSLGGDETFRTAGCPPTVITDGWAWTGPPPETAFYAYGTVNPNGLATTYYFETCWPAEPSKRCAIDPTSPGEAGSGTVPVEVSTLSDTEGCFVVTYRLVAENSAGTSYGEWETIPLRYSECPEPELKVIAGERLVGTGTSSWRSP
jgi:hypothetical protein